MGPFVGGVQPKTFAPLTTSGGLNLRVLLHLASLAQLEACWALCPKVGYSVAVTAAPKDGVAAGDLAPAPRGIAGTARDPERTAKPKKHRGRLNTSP